MIEGSICSGVGGVSAHLTENPDALAARSEAAGVGLYPGTLNIRVEDTADAVADLGEPSFSTDRDNSELGPLWWWPVAVVRGDGRVPGWVVRHDRTSTDYLEVMSDTMFRALGWENGDAVTVEGR